MAEWKSESIEQLKNLYVENNVPSDSLIKDKSALEAFTNKLNAHLINAPLLSAKEIAGKLLQLRKSGKLPRIRN